MTGNKATAIDDSEHYTGPWRDGSHLVVAAAHTEAMPGRCIRCNAHATTFRTQPLPLPKRAGPLPGSLLKAAGGLAWLIEAKRMPFTYALCDRHATFTAHRVGMLAGLGSLVLMVVGVGSMMSTKASWPSLVTIVLSVVLLGVVLVAALNSPQVDEVNGTDILIGGVGRPFLESLPKFAVRASRLRKRE